MIYFMIVCIILQRFIELYIAHRNEQWMLERGGVEVGNEHYKFFVLLHVSFFIFLLYEVSTLIHHSDVVINIYFFIVLILAQIGRVWCIVSLGRFWNTKIIVLPKVVLIRKGPYKYFKHPNYAIVFVELLVIPAMFGAYLTAIIFPLLHLFLLSIRIPSEERALGRRIP